MGIASETIRSDYDGDGATAAFAVGFKYFADDHVTVIHVDSAGTETTWTRGSEYTLSGDGAAITGQVDVDTSPTDYTPAAGEKLVVLLDPPNKQEILLPSGNYLDDIEKMGDIIVQQILNLLDGNNRALQAPLSESSIGNIPTATARAGKLLRFNSSTGAPEVVAAADVDLETVSAYIATLLGAVDAAAARATLGAAALAVANTFTKTQTWTKGADIASANALTLGDGNYFDITGTTDITSIGTKGVGTVVKLHFDAALTLTHHATDLILPGGANITTAAGDEAEFVEYATGDWRCLNYQRATGMPVDQYIGWDLIETQTASGVSSIDFDTGFSSAYDQYKMVLTNVLPATDDSELRMLLSDDAGATYEADASDYSYYINQAKLSDATGTQDADDTAAYILLCSDTAATALGNASDEGWSGTIEFHGMASAAHKTSIVIRGIYFDPAGLAHHVEGGACMNAVAANDGIQFLMESGNIASGTFSLYGLRKSI